MQKTQCLHPIIFITFIYFKSLNDMFHNNSQHRKKNHDEKKNVLKRIFVVS